MGSALSKNRARAAESTETTLYLQEVCRGLRRGVDQKRQAVVNIKADHVLSNEATSDASSPTPINNSIDVQLQDLEETLSSLEQKLRSRGHWHPPRRLSQTTSPSIANISDLSSAVKHLTAKIDATHPSLQTSPRQFFAGHSWQWDASWKEFYTFVPSQQTYIYLSQWRMDASGLWWHINMSWSNQTAEEAMDLIGSWEDWTYDPLWREWYIEVVQGNEGAGEKCCIYASPWQVREGGWYYIGRIGGTG